MAFSHLVPPPGSIYFNHIPISHMSQLTTHASYSFFSCMAFECRHNIRNQRVSTAIPSPSSFRDITTLGTHQHLGEILKGVFFVFFFKTVWHVDRHSTQYRQILFYPRLASVFIRTHKD